MARYILCSNGCGKLCGRGGRSAPPEQITCRRCRGWGAARKCLGCGCSFDRKLQNRSGKRPQYSQRRYCDSCFDAKVWIKAPGVRSESHYARAIRFGVERERVNRLRVFERDKWRCGICRKRVDKRLKYPHPMSASLDHIVPMVHGGGHTYANGQCAHLKCNVDKRAGGHGEQLALVG
jgi:hypothetical protein